MSQTDPTVIVISRPETLFFGRLRSFVVRIDGRKVGYVTRPGPGEFPVEPGEHTVAVSMDWVRSRPLQVVVEPGSKTDLMIGSRSSWVLKFILPMILVAAVTPVFLSVWRPAPANGGDNVLLLIVVQPVIYSMFFAVYLFLTLVFGGDYWALFALNEAGAKR